VPEDSNPARVFSEFAPGKPWSKSQNRYKTKSFYLRATQRRFCAQDASILSTMLSMAIDRIDGVVGVGGAFPSDLVEVVGCCNCRGTV